MTSPRPERSADQRGGRTDRAGLAAALGAERIVRAGLALVAFGDQVGQVVGAGDGVVHERAGDQLAAPVIGAMLEQRLAETLRQAAVDLATGITGTSYLLHSQSLLPLPPWREIRGYR